MKIHKNGTAKAGGASLGGSKRYSTTYASIRIVPNNNTNKNDSILISSSHIGLLCFYFKELDDPHMKMH